MRFKRTIFALATVLLSGTITAVPVHAQTGAEADCICGDKCEADDINKDCEVCCKDFTVCQGKERPDTDTKSEDAISESAPLTPEGNMTLVDDITTDAGDTSKQFFTVISKDGHYFYIIIDRDDSGNNTVHFLNQVDEADLLSLMEEDDVKAYQAALEAQESKENDTKTSLIQPKDETVKDESTGADEKKAEADKKKKSKSKAPLAAALVIICLMAAAGGIFWYSGHKGKKADDEEVEDPDADYSEDEEYELSGEDSDAGEDSDESAGDTGSSDESGASDGAESQTDVTVEEAEEDLADEDYNPYDEGDHSDFT